MDKQNGLALTVRPQDELPVQQVDAATLEMVLATGDLSKLKDWQRLAYITAVCRSVGLNPLTQPFQYITLKGKLTLYARKEAADQLAAARGVSIAIVSKRREDDMYIVDAVATTKDGRRNMDSGITFLGGLRGEDLINAMLKAISKARRRAILGLCGLGWALANDDREDEAADFAPYTEGGYTDLGTGDVPQATHPAISAAKATLDELADQIGQAAEDRIGERRNLAEVVDEGFGAQYPDPHRTATEAPQRDISAAPLPSVARTFTLEVPAQAGLPMVAICPNCQRNQVRPSAFEGLAAPIVAIGVEKGWCVPCSAGEVNKRTRSGKPSLVEGGSR